ncbi:PspA domain-containing protein [Gordonia sp. Z-3]|uniref:PspA domain-containing protein n=2 Tax=Gordonia TaxID=2053 RepID=A0A9X3D2T9_9ACTN|nr:MULTISPECIES: PspA domain-containing protein [Gordonia]MAU81019.1 PspA domain-containing protein [Gordonia sp. (in: high G+C Gram-positive bacteria)]MCF3938328.1 PspA domain-containing protein [Gordonia tangerina]MCX2964013.1 PspA domain-containing protein [Gordonia aquimaris]MED5801721.1 PspA domain-containing protein [Gordonia sp. Z-3]
MTSHTPKDPNPDVIEGEVVADPASAPPATSESVPPVTDPYYSESGVPTFDFVRDKIENRISTAIGSEELAHASPEGRQVDEMMRTRDEAAKRKLDEIRKSMGK